MIDSARLRRLLLVAAVLFFLSAGIAFLAGAPTLAGGLLLGFGLGAAPFASWGWVVSRGMSSTRARALAVVLLALKLAAYAGALYLLVLPKRVDPVGVAIGIGGVAALVVVGALLTPTPSREAA
jgi:hypothetical protein